MKSIIRHMKYLANKKTGVCLLLSGLLLFSSCSRNELPEDRSAESEAVSEPFPESEITGESFPESGMAGEPVHENIGESDEVSKEFSAVESEQEFSAAEPYAYEVEEMVFSFSVSEDKTYYIPYVRVSGCPNEQLQWKINHTLWEECCWIFDCAEIGDHLYSIFDSDEYGEYAMKIAGVYQYGQYLSILYDRAEDKRLPGKIAYAIVIDTLSGNRILLGDIIEDEKRFQDMLVHYFDDDRREIRRFIFEEDAEEIMYYGRMTEAETIIDNVTFRGEYPQNDNGKIGSVTCIYRSASFYMSEEGFVVLPGAAYFEPLVFDWKEMEGVMKE